MKFKLVPLLSLIVFLFACNQKEVDQLNKEKQELIEESQQKEKQIDDMLASFGSIQENLQQITAREGILSVIDIHEGENVDIEESIKNEVQLINQLMQDNEKLIETLNKKLQKSDAKLTEFRKLVSGLNQRITEKNQEIALLNQQLQDKKILIGQLYFKNDSLSYLNKVKDAELNAKVDEMNVGYFTYGTYKELKEKNVLTKEGGFLGIGKNEELKDDFNKDYFSKIDIRKQKSFLIYAEKAELITTHPKNSYEFMGEGKVDSLVIKDADAFWNVSKYLVIVVD